MYIRGLVLPLSCLSFLSSSRNVLYYLSNTTLLPVSVSSCLSPSAPSPSLALIPVTQPCPRSLALGHLTFPLSGPARPRPTFRIPSPRPCGVPRPVTSSLEPAPVPSRPVTNTASKDTPSPMWTPGAKSHVLSSTPISIFRIICETALAKGNSSNSSGKVHGLPTSNFYFLIAENQAFLNALAFWNLWGSSSFSLPFPAFLQAFFPSKISWVESSWTRPSLPSGSCTFVFLFHGSTCE
jgi:hypothetical protein